MNVLFTFKKKNKIEQNEDKDTFFKVSYINRF